MSINPSVHKWSLFTLVLAIQINVLLVLMSVNKRVHKWSLSTDVFTIQINVLLLNDYRFNINH